MSKIMLRTIFLLLVSCPFSYILAQAPQKMSYQAILRNSSSELIVNTVVGMRISIIQGSENGIEVYTEVQKPSTNANGLVTIAIGSGTAFKGSFSSINWGDGPYFIKTETDPKGGDSYTIIGLSQFMSVPYALFAANSGSAADGKSAYEIWKEQAGNQDKTEADFLTALKGTDGKSAFEVWTALAGNTGKTETDFIEAIKGIAGAAGEKGEKGDIGVGGAIGPKGEIGAIGKSAFEIWKEQAGNAERTEADFLESIKGPVGEKGESVYDIWKKDPANAGKTEKDFLENIKAVKGDKGEDGKSAFEIWKEQTENAAKTEADFIAALKGADGKDGIEGLVGPMGPVGDIGAKGESVYDIWMKNPANEGKTETDFLEDSKGVKGDKGMDGKSAYELWKEKDGNAEKTLADYEASLMGQNGKTILNGITDPTVEQGTEGDFFINTETLTFFGPKANDGTWPAGSILKGTNGIGLDFRGSYVNLEAYTAAGNTEELNKAYYNSTDKKSYIRTEKGWEMFAQDGTGGTGGVLDFNVDRNITRAGLPGVGTNLGAGKTTAQFLEDFFFPRLAATAPTATLSGSSLDIPYATWKNFSGFATNLTLNYTVTNRSKQDDTEDKNIASIRLLSGGTQVDVAQVNNSVNPMTGTFSNVAFSNTVGSKTADFSKTFQLEVKDEQPTTVNSNTLTAYMRKANRLTVSTPTISPSTLVYEYGTEDIPITLNWTFNKNDEIIQDIKVSGVSTGSIATVSKQVVFKAMANGGTESQNYSVAINGDIYGVTTVTSPTIRWESTLYRGTISSPIAPCENGFSISDSSIANGSTTLLGGSWKGDTGYDFVCDAGGKYVFYAYPDDGAAPVVEYYDATFKAWQRYPDNQLKVITKTNFENASGYKGKTYKLVFVCVEYKSATVKIRIN